MAEIVQIQPCMDLEGMVVPCDPSEAAYFGVYIGAPGEFQWLADFSTYLNALAWAQDIANLNGLFLQDLVDVA